ncbi:sigma-70 family RNA polymerase sigma factor [Rhodobacteraceae bacterium 2CG4]|uniref:Sigma-70 family RNA polymerase sigma factor n=1 Tax=Halovulum marinum TaxID=2662447 RepID=A0A6L5YX39_9RHOB|nr:RNA polymerase sigma factor [Halovulum marinum]MSU88777.1 sigma-70 family RNA polymerase sigma factor [Halovulum marinum]
MSRGTGWIGDLLAAARPQAVAALLRHFRDLDRAEEAFQEACVRALRTWPEKGPPRNAAAWLIMVGRNAMIDAARRTKREAPLAREEAIPDAGTGQDATVARIDEADYRDDILRLLFVCCHPVLKPTDQVALSLRIVGGLSVGQIARAFLVGDSAMEQRITRAKRRIAQADVGYEVPGPVERAERIGAVAGVIYLVFNEGYTTGIAAEGARAALCEEAIRLGRLLQRLFPTEPEIMGLLALMLLQHARAGARFDDAGEVIPLDRQDRARWDGVRIAEGRALVDKAARHARPGGYQLQAAIAAQHARAQGTDWGRIAQLYAALEHLQPSPVVTLNRAVALLKAGQAEDAWGLVAPLASQLDGYFYFHGARGAILRALGRADEAREAFAQAISLANTAAEAAHMRDQLDAL